MKNYIKNALVVAFALATFVLGGAHAFAATQYYVAWNNDPSDCPTVSVANYSSNEGATTNSCWPTSISAQPGDHIDVEIFFHNTGNENSGTSFAKLNMPTGTRSTFSFTGIVSSGSGAEAVGSGNINLSTPETLTLNRVDVFKDESINPTQSTDGSLFTSSLALGQINAPGTCPASNTKCHEGAIRASFIVGSTGTNGSGTSCSISSFNANPSSVSSGSSSTLTWNTTGCDTVAISGINGSLATSGSTSTGALTNTQSYTLTATGSDGVAHTQTTSVSVNQTQCFISSFYANPTQVTSGNTSTITWNTSGCTNVTVAGAGVSSSQTSGSATTGAIYGTNTYTISASNSSMTASPQTVTVTASQNNQNNCSISSFYASPSQVNYGNSAVIYWTTNGCTSASLSGSNASGSGTTGSVTTGPVYGSTYYTLTAYGSNGSPVTQNLTVYTINNNQNNQSCSIGSFYASPSQVGYGDSTTLYWTNTSGGQVTVTGGTLSSSYQYGSSVNTGPIYGTTTYTITPTNCSNGYAQSQSLTVYVGTNNNTVGSITPITTLADNVSAYSARLNGLISSTNGGSLDAYFEYGTTEALGQQTSQQLVSTSSATNYFDTISTSPNTTYYYRAAAVYNGTIYRGSIIEFTTPGLVTSGGGGYVAPTYVYTRTYGVGGGSAFVSLSITDQFQSVSPGDMVVYTINYKNITNKPLTNATLNVILPEGVTFRESTQGVLTTNNTVVANLGTLDCDGQGGTVTIEGMIDNTVTPGSTLVATSTLAFTTPSGAQDSAVAYAVNTVTQRPYITTFGLFGSGFFPTTLLGWILLIAIIILVILLIRHLSYTRRAAPVVMQNSHDYHDSMHR